MSLNRSATDGAHIYQPWLLSFYDFLIMRVLSPIVWRCDVRHFADLYTAWMSRNHADVGVGTGYFLDRCRYAPGEVRIGLFDLQQHSLDHTARRLARFQPETYRRNALEPLHIDGAGFDSIALGGILHCIPGDMTHKGAVFDALKPLMRQETRVFGYTILNRGIRKTTLSRLVYFILQRLKVINGLEDSAAALQAELQKRFRTIHVRVVGCIAIFVAHAPLPAV